MPNSNPNLTHLKQALTTNSPKFQLGSKGRDSAVMIPLIWKENQWHLLFEVRSSRLNTQPGEICFPGGGIDAGETPLEAAMREVCEELKIQPSQIELVGESDGSVSPRGTLIWTYVCVLHDYENTYSKEEVAEVFTVPLKELKAMKPVIGKVRQKTELLDDFPVHLLPNKKNYSWGEPVKEVLFYPWKEYIIWGVTARILSGFLAALDE